MQFLPEEAILFIYFNVFVYFLSTVTPTIPETMSRLYVRKKAKFR